LVVEIHLHTTLQRNTETGLIRKVDLVLPPDSTLAEVLVRLEIHLPEEGLLLVVNGRTADINSQLNDGDIIHVIPAVSGG
jgi:molybdopterin converting factor small subunit